MYQIHHNTNSSTITIKFPHSPRPLLISSIAHAISTSTPPYITQQHQPPIFNKQFSSILFYAQSFHKITPDIASTLIDTIITSLVQQLSHLLTTHRHTFLYFDVRHFFDNLYLATLVEHDGEKAPKNTTQVALYFFDEHAPNFAPCCGGGGGDITRFDTLRVPFFELRQRNPTFPPEFNTIRSFPVYKLSTKTIFFSTGILFLFLLFPRAATQEMQRSISTNTPFIPAGILRKINIPKYKRFLQRLLQTNPHHRDMVFV